MLQHQHLIIDCFVKKPIVDVDLAISWLTKLVNAIGMKIVAGPIAAYCNSDNNCGITGAVCIETSHCSIHFWDQVDKPYLRLDVYSCKSFDETIVLNMLEEFLPYEVKTISINRNPN